MKKVALLVCLLAGIVMAHTKSYSVTLDYPTMIAGTELGPGHYRVEIDGQKLWIKRGHEATETDVKVETGDKKYDTTAVVYSTADGKHTVDEIWLGGTRTKLVLKGAAMGEAAGGK